jgi:hypothetical protein
VANEYQVASAIPLALHELQLRGALPQATLDYFDGFAAEIRRRNERGTKQAIEVAKILNRIGVSPILLKGGANLMCGLYADIAARVMADLDILVPAERVEECNAQLRNAGFQALTHYRHPRGHHFPPLGRHDLPLPLELHHQVLAHPYGAFLTAEEMREKARVLDRHGASIAVPSATHSVMLNVAHTQLSNHDYLYGRIDLRALLDFALLSRAYAKEIDWYEIWQRFVLRRGGVALNYHMLCARNLLHTRIYESGPTEPMATLLYRRATYLVRYPRLLDLSVRFTRPWLLLRRELSEPTLRRRLAANVTDRSWWARHLKLLAGRH